MNDPALAPTSRRQIGAIGTAARVVLGLLLLTYGVLGGRLIVSNGQLRTGFSPLAVVLGLVALPTVLLVGQWLRSRRTAVRLQATGSVATSVNMLIFFALILTPLYAPPLSFVGNAALVFYGASMLLAAARGYAGCEVLAFSNWLLRRDDQVGCLVLSPIDQFESGLAHPAKR
jgi:hypothetical protein